MAKRSAVNDLNHDNWDREEPEEEAGVFKRANKEVIQKRVIKTAKRRISSPLNEDKKAFSAFSGFGLASAPVGINSDSLKSTFSFLSKTQNGKGSKDKKEDESGAVGEVTNPCLSSNIISNESEEKYISTYYQKLKELNESLVEWINLHVKKDSCCILTPVFKDYEKHLEELEKEKNRSVPCDKKDKVDCGIIKEKSTNESSVIPSFSFGQAKPAGTSPLQSSLFGKFPVPTSQTTGLGGIKLASGPVTPFSFTSGKPTIFGNVMAPQNEKEENKEGDNESEELPKEEVKLVTEEDAIFSQRVKVYVKKEDSYSERGTGTLYVKKVPSTPDKHQVIVRADTSLGNLLLNFLLSESTPVQRTGKNNVILACIPTPDSKPPPVPVLLRVKTSEDADNLKAKLDEFKGRK